MQEDKTVVLSKNYQFPYSCKYYKHYTLSTILKNSTVDMFKIVKVILVI